MADGPVTVRTVKGQIEDIEAKLHKAAHGDALKAVRKIISRDTLKARKEFRAAALGTLPHKGGLNKWAAVTPSAITREGKNGIVVTIRMTRGKHDFKALDRGEIRHPLFGLRGRGDWFTQNVPPGFFTLTAARLKPKMESDVAEGIRQYAEQFNKPGH